MCRMFVVVVLSACGLLFAHTVFAQTNPIAYWAFDEGSGTSALDSAGNNHSCTLVGATYVSGRTNTALSFNGSGNYAFISDTDAGGATGAGLDMGTRDWTVAAWVKTTNSGMVVTKMGFVGGPNPDSWGLSISTTGTVGAVLGKYNGTLVNIFNGDGKVVNDGQWHHIAAVFNRTGNLIRYADGLATGTQYSLTALNGQSIDSTNQLRIGARDQAGSELYFNGVIDDARVYARALGPNEIAALAGVTPPAPPVWSTPVSLVDAYGRIALGNRIHVVGHIGSNLIYRSSQDNGATWSDPSVIAPASGNYPMQYGGLYSVGDTVYLLTAAGDMGPLSQPLDFRKSTNNGLTWSSPIRITMPGQEIRRANMVVSSNTVHVFGGQSDSNPNGYGTGVFYFRSTNGGVNWDPGIKLYDQADSSARMAVDGNTVHVCFGVLVFTNSYGGRSTYMESTNNGTTWGPPIFIGENSAVSDVQARQEIVAADGHLITLWQRERPSTGNSPLPTNRIGYNRSIDAGATWLGLQLLPGDQILATDTNVVNDHPQVWMNPGGSLHIVFAHGPPGVATTPLGYVFSPNYGASWTAPEIALTSFGGGVPDGIVADENWVHVMAEPGFYARRRVPPVFRSFQNQGQTITLGFSGQGTLQTSDSPLGPWTNSAAAISPMTVTNDSAQRFYRINSP